jgi:GR25 family glycosyltransferase involved in LPS biosynthesis
MVDFCQQFPESEPNISFYCINYKDDERKKRMQNRFKYFNYDLKFVPGVEKTDHRLQNFDDSLDKRTFSIMLQHLDSIHDFVSSDTDSGSDRYCVICEDDIMISRNLKEDFPEIIRTYNKLNLDVLLLGYLVSFKIEPWFTYFPVKEKTDKYYYMGYPDDLWGAQMYFFSLESAKKMLEKYYNNDSAILSDHPFNPDWTLTKFGNRAIIYPMVAVEEGGTKTDHEMQNSFHLACHKMNYNPDVHF